MRRVDAPEILDSENCPANELQAALQTLNRINLWFGGVSVTQRMIERVASAAGARQLSLLEVAAGSGFVPEVVQQRLENRQVKLDVTLLDRLWSHLPKNHLRKNNDSHGRSVANRGVVGDALSLPFRDCSFDLVSCNLFAHHLSPELLGEFVREGLRVSRQALLINDLVRHPLHLALVYASYPIMGSHLAWLDGLTSVRRAYLPTELRRAVESATPLADQVEISRGYLFRMGVIVWKKQAYGSN
jgi:hypothetical protein